MTRAMLRIAGSFAGLHAEAHELEEARVDDLALVDAVGPLSPML